MSINITTFRTVLSHVSEINKQHIFIRMINEGHEDVVNAMSNDVCQITQDEDGKIPLHHAVIANNLAMIKSIIPTFVLLSYMEIKDNHNKTPFHYALDCYVTTGDATVVKYMLQCNDDLKTEKYKTYLLQRSGNIDCSMFHDVTLNVCRNEQSNNVMDEQLKSAIEKSESLYLYYILGFKYVIGNVIETVLSNARVEVGYDVSNASCFLVECGKQSRCVVISVRNTNKPDEKMRSMLHMESNLIVSSNARTQYYFDYTELLKPYEGKSLVVKTDNCTAFLPPTTYTETASGKTECYKFIKKPTTTALNSMSKTLFDFFYNLTNK